MKILLFFGLFALMIGIIECKSSTSLRIDSNPTDKYADSIDLVTEKYKLYWNTTDTHLIAEIHCLTSSWVGFGLSPNGNMDKSDVIIAWIESDGTTHFTVLTNISSF